MNPQNKEKPIDSKIARILQYTLNVALVLLAISLGVLLFKELFFFIKIAFFEKEAVNQYILFEKILLFFLFFEFISMIVKYFQEHYHFPLRYFFYIGITALIRIVIVDHENPIHTFFTTCGILVLIISFYIFESASVRKQKTNF